MVDGPEGVRSKTAGPLSIRIFRALWIATVVSNIGTWMNDVGAAWLMTSLSPSPLMVALVQAATTLPMALLAIPGGALADIVDRRRLLLATQIWAVAASSILFAASITDRVSAELLLAMVFALACGSALSAPAFQAVTGELVPRPMVPQAVALGSLGTNVSRAVGPALGGIVIAAAGPPWVFLANAVSVVGVALVVWCWRGEAKSSNYPPEHLGQAIRAGIRYALSSRELRTVIIRSICFFICASALWSFLPLVAKQQLGAGATGFGLLITFIGAGAVLGGLLMSRLRAAIGANRLSIGATCVVALSIAALALAKSLPLAFACCFAAGVGWIAMVSSLMSSTQLNAAGWVKARSLGIFISIFQGSMALGATIWGILASYAGIQFALVTAGALLAVGSLAGLFWPLKIDPDLDLAPSNHWPTPITDSSIPGDSGPVLITIEYQIDPATADDFLRHLAAMREVRLRDGAMRWGYWRDTSDQSRIFETFVVVSWLEHLRQHDRITNADRIIQERVQAFHIGKSKAHVRHWIAVR